MRNRKMNPGKFILIALFGLGMIVLFIFVVMSLWNWLMPLIFGISIITFWQAAGLLLLSRILFGGFPPGGKGNRHHSKKDYWKKRMEERCRENKEENSGNTALQVG
ncbi:MAG TPA: hypothetical protein DDX92_03020 [Flavobacteriales bacterium]|jgi:hypothetical protein|nr:hypothetical protein [Flavobacteriales bacterium]